MQILDGNILSKQIRNEIGQTVQKYISDGYRAPHLAAVLVGNNPASKAYVGMKIKDCEEVGFKSTLHKFKEDITENELLELIHSMNTDNALDGFIIQLPLPKGISEDRILQAVDPEKDADGFHPANIGKMVLDLPAYLPATPYGIMEILKRYNIETAGKHCVVLGRSHIVGRPVSILLSRKSDPGNCTVTLCHSRTPNIEYYTKQADIIIAAIGIPNFLTEHMVKKDAVIIDVGINRVEDPDSKHGFKLVGDVDFENVKEKAGYITPVPGGVGPMTRAMLLKNTLLAFERNHLKMQL